MLRRCPVCERDSIVGHGRRRKQAHDELHDWISIRRGRCTGCGKTEDLGVRLFDRAGRVTLTKQGAIRFVLCAQNCSGRH